MMSWSRWFTAGLALLWLGCFPLRSDIEIDTDRLRAACAPDAEIAWVDLIEPRDGLRHVVPVGLVEVRGRAGAGAPTGMDLVLLIDRSVSTFALAGVDVDHDGVLGRKVPIEHEDGSAESGVVGRYREDGGGLLVHATDEDDTIFGAELRAAEGLLDRLDPTTTRVGMVAFGGRAKLKAKLQFPSDELKERFTGLRPLPQSGGTNFDAAIRRGIQALAAAQPTSAETRHCVLMLLSDGAPTQPEPELRAEARAYAAARLARDANVRIYSIAVGEETRVHLDIFEHLAELTRAEVVHFATPEEIMTFLPILNLTSLEEVSIWNVTTGQRARAMRMFPDGSFDAYVPLAPGKNLLRVAARALGGSLGVVERTVYFEKRLPRTDEEAQRLKEFQEKLRARTIEAEITNRLHNKRKLSREVTIEIEN